MRRYALPARTGVLGLVAAAGTTLLVVGELSDRLEAALGLGALNLALSAPLAVLMTCVGALLGDTVLGVVGRRSGWRPGPQVAMLALMIMGGVDVGWILASHLERPLRLDGWIALAGGVLLLIVGVGRHQSAPPPGARLSARGDGCAALPD